MRWPQSSLPSIYLVWSLAQRGRWLDQTQGKGQSNWLCAQFVCRWLHEHQTATIFVQTPWGCLSDGGKTDLIENSTITSLKLWRPTVSWRKRKNNCLGLGGCFASQHQRDEDWAPSETKPQNRFFNTHSILSTHGCEDFRDWCPDDQRYLGSLVPRTVNEANETIISPLPDDKLWCVCSGVDKEYNWRQEPRFLFIGHQTGNAFNICSNMNQQQILQHVSPKECNNGLQWKWTIINWHEKRLLQKYLSDPTKNTTETR